MKDYLICSLCKADKPTSEFYSQNVKSRPGRKRKFMSYCKPCASGARKEWLKKHPEHTKQQYRKRCEKFPWKKAWYNLSTRATKRGWGIMDSYDFSIWFISEIKQCVYCGMSGEASKAMFKELLSIDRIDNAKGYVKGNIVFACRRCNNVKSSALTFEQMKIVANMFFRPKVIV